MAVKVADVAYPMSVSPDGGLVATIGRGGNLTLVDSETGEHRNVTNSQFPELVMGAMFSHSGEQIAFAWHNADDFDDLRIVGTDGAGERVVYRDPDVRSIWVKDWSPEDQDVLALLLGYDRTMRIVTVPVTGDSVVLLANVDAPTEGIPGRMLFSPNGDHIAFDVAPQKGPVRHDIYYIGADGGAPRELVRHPADDRLVGWSPDGSAILFASDRSGTIDLWELDVRDRETPSEARLLKSRIGQLAPLRMTRGGDFYYGTVSCDCHVYVGELNPESGLLDGPPRSLGKAFHNSGATWSPDGRSIAYIAPTGGVVPTGSAVGRTVWALVILSWETGEERRFYPEIDRIHQLRPLWSPEGDRILLKGWDRNAYPRVVAYEIDAATGTSSLVHQESSLWRGSFDWIGWSNYGRSLIYVDTRPDLSAGIVVRDLQNGTVTELTRGATPPYVYGLTASPDGSNLAFGLWDTTDRTSSLVVLNRVTVAQDTLVRTALPVAVSPPSWYPDSRHLMYEADGTLWRVGSNGEGSEDLGSYAPLRPNQAGISIHPDGDRVVFVSENARASEVWILTDLFRD